MATILLQAVGGALGGLIGGPFGAVAGRALGALGGYAVDSRLMAKTQRVEGSRLTASRVLEADEGGGIARLYGTARIAGQVIWTTRFEEASNTERQGGKGTGGGVETTTYSYFGNVAIGLCEGPVAFIRRIWADGEELDLSLVEYRLHTGEEDQQPDPLIEAKQGAGNAPAYRGLAYIVFERLPLERWGNRIPQISCEVIRPVGELERELRAVTIIPGASEHGLDPLAVRETLRPGEDRLANRNMLHGASDFLASIDELTALAPKLERAALVVTWFVDDLRVGKASVRPGVEVSARDESVAWQVGETTRETARLVSRVDGGAAFGGTPSDVGVVRSIAALKGRGLKVTYYPFLLMDVPPGNGLPDPYGNESQASFPWRGRMTLDIEPGRPGSTNGTALVREDVARFLGRAKASDYRIDDGRVRYSGPAEWSYRRMVLHQAWVARLAGGVDAFVIGSEMRGLTQLRDETGRFPFVDALIALAADVKTVLPGAKVTYAADWSEYFGYQPADGSGDVFFNLDPLWASPAIDMVGIDNYLPLTDWRDETTDGPSPYDRETLETGIAGGEYFDWYYASAADRGAGRRSPITDGAGKPWVFRAKDLKGWWSNPHHERHGGLEMAEPTPWVPMSKPVWFTELGCPAIDRGANQPNVFVDPKSSESAVPHFSIGARDDLQQRRFLEAHGRHWGRDDGALDDRNPVSPIYGGRMVAADAIHLWTWDARPYPAFPQRTDVWRDGDNWQRGHWLTGRLGRAPLDGLISALMRDHGFEDVEVEDVDAEIGGYLLPGPGAARSQLEELLRLTGVEMLVRTGRFRFRSVERQLATMRVEALADEPDVPLVETRRDEESERPEELVVGYGDPLLAYQPAAASAELGRSEKPRQATVELPVALENGEARRLAEALLLREARRREVASFGLSPGLIGVEPGDRLELPGLSGAWQVERIEDGTARRVTARKVAQGARLGGDSGRDAAPGGAAPAHASKPVVHLIDLPSLGLMEESARAAVYAKPWIPHHLLASPTGSGFEARLRVGRSARMGRLAEPLGAGPEASLDRANQPLVEIFGGALASVSQEEMLAGANRAAILAPGGIWEVLQFERAEEEAAGFFRLSRLLRAQGGTESAMANAPYPGGTPFVMLDDGALPIALAPGEIGAARNWLAVPSGRALDDATAVRRSATLGARALLPLSPVHLRAAFEQGGDVTFTWIRRSRNPADNWDGLEAPLAEDSEAYRVWLSGNGISEEFDCAEPAVTLTAVAQKGRFGGLPETLDIRVAQIGAAGPGSARAMVFHRP